MIFTDRELDDRIGALIEALGINGPEALKIIKAQADAEVDARLKEKLEALLPQLPLDFLLGSGAKYVSGRLRETSKGITLTVRYAVKKVAK